MSTFVSHSEDETIKFAEQYAKQLHVGDVIILSGELGSGKTKFVQGVLRHFNMENEISSPTFTIVNEYISEKIKIYHFDLYRLADIEEFYAIGGDEYLQNGICIFEWGEILEKDLPKYTKIKFTKGTQDVNERTLNIEEVSN